MMLLKIAKKLPIPPELEEAWFLVSAAIQAEAIQEKELIQIIDGSLYRCKDFQLEDGEPLLITVHFQKNSCACDKDALWLQFRKLQGQLLLSRLAAEGHSLADHIKKLLSRKTKKKQEQEILLLLEEATTEQLQRSLSQLSFRNLFGALDNHWRGEKNRQHLIEILGIDRLVDLDVTLRFRLLHALQHNRMNRFHQQVVHSIFLGTEGADLHLLTSLLESTGTHRNLYSLLFEDIEDHVFREEILSHFAQQAIQRSYPKILSDIDDTIYVNWKDEKFSKKTPYPGMKTFYLALDRGDDGEPRGDICFVTARPRDRSGISQNFTFRSLKKLGFGKANLLSGRWNKIHSSKAIMECKWENFQHYQQLHPGRKFIFIGDSGQLDVEFACRMLDSGQLLLALIHRIIPRRSSEWEKEYIARGVFFFDSFVGAAEIAAQHGFLSWGDALEVMRDAQKEIEGIRCKKKEERVEEIEEDAKKLRQRIKSN